MARGRGIRVMRFFRPCQGSCLAPARKGRGRVGNLSAIYDRQAEDMAQESRQIADMRLINPP